MALLLSPHRLITDYIIIESLHVIKSPKGIDFKTEVLNNSELKKHYPQLPKPARDILMWFSKGGMDYIKQEIKETYALRKHTADYDSYYRNEMLRKIYDLLLKLKPFAASQ